MNPRPKLCRKNALKFPRTSISWPPSNVSMYILHYIFENNFEKCVNFMANVTFILTASDTIRVEHERASKGTGLAPNQRGSHVDPTELLRFAVPSRVEWGPWPVDLEELSSECVLFISHFQVSWNCKILKNYTTWDEKIYLTFRMNLRFDFKRLFDKKCKFTWQFLPLLCLWSLLSGSGIFKFMGLGLVWSVSQW